LGPMLASLWISFTNWDLITSPEIVGLRNYRAMFRDDLVWQALKVTTIYAITSVPLHIAVGFSLAWLLNTNVRGMRIYRTAFYLPSVLSGVAVALLWRWLFSTEFGLFNTLLSYVGIVGPSWLGDPKWALSSLVLMSLWGVGAGAIIYLAGLQGIPTDLYEAADVDGASTWTKVRHITLPMMSPTIFFVVITNIIFSFQIFTNVYVMTGSAGGPANSTMIYVLHLYLVAFRQYRLGYASALAWVLFVILLLLTLFIFKSSSLWVYYESEVGGKERA
ncbi:MAG: sugar ABC transporter permease, partial [Caldilineaceae bacterium]|nr:sugar ABC transporter permease [Caldilineaceae bacterium]